MFSCPYIYKGALVCAALVHGVYVSCTYTHWKCVHINVNMCVLKVWIWVFFLYYWGCVCVCLWLSSHRPNYSRTKPRLLLCFLLKSLTPLTSQSQWWSPETPQPSPRPARPDCPSQYPRPLTGPPTPPLYLLLPSSPASHQIIPIVPTLSLF